MIIISQGLHKFYFYEYNKFFILKSENIFESSLLVFIWEWVKNNEDNLQNLENKTKLSFFSREFF